MVLPLLTPFAPVQASLVTCLCCFLATSGAFGHPGDKSADPLNGSQIVMDTSFEPGQSMPKLEQHQLVTDKARSGSHALMGEVTKPRQACYLRIPFQARAGMELRASCQVCGDKGVRATLWVRTGTERTKISDVTLEARWQEVRGAHLFTNDTEGTVEIVA